MIKLKRHFLKDALIKRFSMYFRDTIDFNAPLANGSPNLAMLGVIIADSWTRIPFMGIILLAALMSIPQELHEAAKVDGADTLARFRHISLPLIKQPALVGF